MKNRITIGIPSIVLIFMILCLAVFSLLSLSDAKSALTFAQKRADTVQMYYEADANAQAFIRDYRALYAEKKNMQAALDELVSAPHSTLPPGSQLATSDEQTVICNLPMRSGQTLHVELEEDGNEILSYCVYNNTDYTIDSDLPVWGGN